jgi:hypothetical protein
MRLEGFRQREVFRRREAATIGVVDLMAKLAIGEVHLWWYRWVRVGHLGWNNITAKVCIYL